MAKKKTAEKAKIEAAPVLRAGGGGDDPVITKSYIMRDDWKDKDVVNIVAFKSVDGEVDAVLVNGEPAGGGGVPMFNVTWEITTASAYAKLTFANASLELMAAEYFADTNAYKFYNDYTEFSIGTHEKSYACFSPNNRIEFTFIDGEDGNLQSITGDASYSDGVLRVTGDCKISITGIE